MLQPPPPLMTVATTSSIDENDEEEDDANIKNKRLRSPARTRFGLFRRKLLMEVNDDDDDDDILTTSSSTPPTSGTAAAAVVTTTAASLFRGGATTTTTTTGSSSSTGKTTGYFSIHGVWTMLSQLFHVMFVQKFCLFANFVGTTKTRCFCLLVFSVFIESYATTLSKQAKDTGNALLFARACLVYLVWYVQ